MSYEELKAIADGADLIVKMHLTWSSMSDEGFYGEK